MNSEADPGADGFESVGELKTASNARSVVSFGGRKVAIARVDGMLYAFEDTCPHQGASLAEGHIEGGVVHCPWHGWRFELASGTCRESAYGALDLFDVKVEGEQVYLRLRKPRV